MHDRVIVTVQNENRNWQLDMELPAQVPYADFQNEMLTALSQTLGRTLQGERLFVGETEITRQMTLTDACVRDASILTLKG